MSRKKNTIDKGFLIHDKEKDCDFRIIYKQGNYLAAIRVNSVNDRLLFAEFDTEQLNALVDKKQIVIREPDFKYFDPDTLNDKEKAIYNRNQDIVRQIQKEYGPLYFDLANRKKKPLLRSLSVKYRIQQRTILNIVRKYLMSGMNESSLLSKQGEHDSSSVSYQRKTGRKSSIGNLGIVITDEVKAIFDEAKKQYLSGREKSYQTTYDWMCAKYFTEPVEVSTDKGTFISHQLLPLDKRPTKKQMENYIRKNTTKMQREVSKSSKREFRNNSRLLVADNLYNVRGPGDVVEMDEVEMDVSIISEYDPTQTIGRPIVHAMIDVYSRLIMAVSVSLENNSVLGLTNCLINLAEDKKTLCLRYGLDLRDGLWDVCCLPNKVRTDRGSEYRSYEGHRIFKELGITIDLEPPAMGSLKGQVEQLFHQYHSNQNDLLENKGLITKRYDSRHHQQALLTLNDIWVFVINQTIAHNMLTMQNYPLTPDMVKRNVAPTPIQIWNYGCEKYGAPRPIEDTKQFEYKIRKSVTARISRKGIEWNGLYYMPVGHDPKMYAKMTSLGNCKESINCRLDQRDIGTLWYISDGRIIEARLNPNRAGNADFDHTSLKEYEAFKERKKELINGNRQQDQEVRVALRNGLEATVNNAQRSMSEIPYSSRKTTEIRESRRMESATNLVNNTISDRLQNESEPQKAIQAIEPPHEKHEEKEDIANMSLEEVLRSINKDMW